MYFSTQIVTAIATVLCVLIISPLSAQAGTNLKTPKQLTATYNEEKSVLTVQWKKVQKAKQYQVQLLDASSEKRVAGKKVKKQRASFAESLFTNEKTYIVRVRALRGKRMMSAWQTTQYTHATSTTVPTFTPVIDNTTVSGTNVWVFIVDDGQSTYAASAENNGSIVMGRTISQNEKNIDTNSWGAVLTPAHIGGSDIADHWHIYAHGAHWVVASTKTADESMLVKISTNFTVEKVVTVVKGTTIPTNDMFLVEEPNGVAVGHFLPGKGHRVFRFDTNATLINTVDIGDGDYAHSNGASAMRLDGGYLVLAPTTLISSSESNIQLMQFDDNWQEKSVTTLIEEDGNNVAMASGVYVDEYLIVNARVIENATASAAGSSAGGAIVRYVFDSDFVQLSREVIQETGSNRPHTTLSGTDLLLTWDSNNTGVIRLDTVK